MALSRDLSSSRMSLDLDKDWDKDWDRDKHWDWMADSPARDLDRDSEMQDSEPRDSDPLDSERRDSPHPRFPQQLLSAVWQESEPPEPEAPASLERRWWRLPLAPR